MFHSGREFPTFLEDNFRQFRYFNPTVPVYFLTDYGHIGNPVFAKYSVMSINKDEYYCERIHEFERLFGRAPDDFWTVAATRLMYIENFMRLRQMINVYHFENDVLIYFSLSQYNTYIKKHYQIGMTIGGPDKCMTGFAFFKDYKALQHMNMFFRNLLFEYGIAGVKQTFRVDMVNEMTLMRIYSSDADSKLRPFPTMPVPPMNHRLEDFGSLFDPASWGQFVGGTRSEGPGAMPQDHYIGQFLRKLGNVWPTWLRKDGLMVPIFQYAGVDYRINNLHIHSKNLHLYTSKR